MKKITSLILTASMLISSAAMNVQAADRFITIEEALTDASQIHILYNDAVVEYEDVKPVNTEGRVMIPFRAVLENMGATVEYDDSQRLVTATKGETQIKFTLMDDTIYINNNGVDSTITMDVPMIIVEGRTLVPIRFMSNALGMQVGWDGETETVVIMDYDDYFDEVNEIMPNMTKVTQLKTPVFNKETIGFDVFMAVEEGTEKVEITLGGDVDGVYTEAAAQVGAKVDVNFNGQKIDDIALDIAFKDSNIYLKTNLIEKISSNIDDSTIVDDKDVKAMLSTVKADTWYKVDLKAVFEAMELPAEVVTEFEKAVKMMGSNDTMTFGDALKMSISTEGDVAFDDAISMAMMLDMFEEIDKFIKVEEKANDGYSVSINMTTAEIIDVVSKIFGGILSEEDKAMLESMMNVDVSAVSECDGKTMESNAKFVMNYNYDGTKLDFTFELADKAENDPKAKVEEIKECEDVTQILIEALK